MAPVCPIHQRIHVVREAIVEVNEAELIERLRSGDQSAFTELVQNHQAQVYRLLLRILGDAAEAEDVAQDVFVSVFKALANFRGDSRLSTWLYRIASNHAKNRLKYLARRGRESRKVYDEQVDPGQISTATTSMLPSPDRLIEGYEAQTHVERALSALDSDQRLLVVLRDIEHLSYEEVQSITGLPIGTVKSRLHRARLALFQNFRGLQEDSPQTRAST